MIVSKIRGDGVFDGFVEFPDGTKSIPVGHSFSLPPEIPSGYYAIMMGGWILVEGETPVWPPLPSPEEIIQRIYNESVINTQQILDDFAKTRGYDSILSACSYVTSTVDKFRIEAQYCVESRDSMWATLYQIMNDVQVGNRPIPDNWDAVFQELPALQWPN